MKNCKIKVYQWTSMKNNNFDMVKNLKMCTAHSLKPRSPTYPTCDAIFWVAWIFDIWVGLSTFFSYFKTLIHCPHVLPCNFTIELHLFLSFSLIILAYLSKQLSIDPWHTCRKGDDPNTQTPSQMLLLLFWALLMVAFGCHQWQDQASRWNFKSVMNQLFFCQNQLSFPLDCNGNQI